MKLKQLYKNENKWTKGTFARDKDNSIVNLNSPRAHSFCLAGAFHHCYNDVIKREQAKHKLRKYLTRYAHCDCIVTFNDNKKRRFADIQRIVNKLDI